MTTKSIITRIGTKDDAGNYVGWEFDHDKSIPDFGQGEGPVVLGGYTAVELDAIMVGILPDGKILGGRRGNLFSDGELI